MQYHELYPGTATMGQYAVTGIWHYGNKDKIIKAAGNITALTEGASTTGNAYQYAFYDCRKLEDISGLVFTDSGDQGTSFLLGTFEKCTALKTAPAKLLPPGLSNTAFFLSKAFMQSGVETIETGFIPTSYTTTATNFLDHAFEECASLTAIPAGFIPAGLTTVGNEFLKDTFTKSGITAIPADLVAHLTSVGDNFLHATFSQTAQLKSLPANFVPRNLTAMGTGFFSGTFDRSGITAVPAGFIPPPSELPAIQGNFFVSTFAECASLATADLRSFAGTYIEGTPDQYGVIAACTYIFNSCSNLKTLHLSYVSTDGNLTVFESMFLNNADISNLEIYIYGDKVLESANSDLFYYSITDLPAASQIKKIYVKAELIDTYKSSGSWADINSTPLGTSIADIFAALPD
jgi:hypothetical protein